MTKDLISIVLNGKICSILNLSDDLCFINAIQNIVVPVREIVIVQCWLVGELFLLLVTNVDDLQFLLQLKNFPFER